jgi:hypothetical protein
MPVKAVDGTVAPKQLCAVATKKSIPQVSPFLREETNEAESKAC